MLKLTTHEHIPPMFPPLQPPCSGSRRAIRSGRMQIMHTVLGWGDSRGHDWCWDQLAPTQLEGGLHGGLGSGAGGGGAVHVSPLHLAAALDDGGYAAELLLLKYDDARRLWRSCRDSRGFLPGHYAEKAGNGHLDALAEEK